MIPHQTSLRRALGDVRLRHRSPRQNAPTSWLLAQRLDDGAWPTGGSRLAAFSGESPDIAKWRTRGVGLPLQHDRALLCLAHHPERRSARSGRALDDWL